MQPQTKIRFVDYVWMVLFALVITAGFGGVIAAFIAHFWISLGVMFAMLAIFFILALNAKEMDEV